jgi:hypothetical protein
MIKRSLASRESFCGGKRMVILDRKIALVD